MPSAILKLIKSTKRCCSHVKRLRLSGILKCHLRLKLEKEFNICNAKMVKWIKHKQAQLGLNQTKGIIMFQFADRNLIVFKKRRITDRKNGSVGINKTTGRTV